MFEIGPPADIKADLLDHLVCGGEQIGRPAKPSAYGM